VDLGALDEAIEALGRAREMAVEAKWPALEGACTPLSRMGSFM